MDMFMDKLAQKLNAQEIIKANTTAEVEELDKLRNRVSEYNDCLDRLQRLVNDSAAKLNGASGEGAAEINRLAEESIAKIRAIQQDAAGIEKLGGQMNSMSSEIMEQLKRTDGDISGKIDQLKRTGGDISEKIDQLTMRMEERPKDGLEEKFTAAEESVHRECVKVYRNVQAVVMEESGKQTETLTEATGKLNWLKGRVGVVLGISVAALLFSLANTVLQILTILGFFSAG